MIYHDAFPLTILLNLSFRNDRRVLAQSQMEELRINSIRSPGIFSSRVDSSYGFYKKSRYACSLAKRIAIRKAKLLGAPAAVIFEDDIVFHQEFHHILSKIDLPPDWGIFFLGCKHLKCPSRINENLLKVTCASDNHAMAVNMKYYKPIIRALSGGCKQSKLMFKFSDINLAKLQKFIPTYATYPNLVWQSPSFSDGAGKFQAAYTSSGHQLSRFT